MKLLIIFLILCTPLFGQNTYYKLFENDIKKGVTVNPEEMNNLIEKSIKIHPNLIYYAMRLVNNGDSSAYSAAYFWYGKNKNMWLNRQIAYSQKDDFSDSLKAKAKRIIKKYWVNGVNMYQSYPVKKPESIEEMQYFVYKYYLKNSGLTFKPEMNYSYEIDKNEAMIFGKMAKILNKKTSQAIIDEAKLSYITEHWYILTNAQYRGKFLNPGDYISGLMRNDPKFKRVKKGIFQNWIKGKLGIEFGYAVNSPLDIENTIHAEDFISKISFQSSIPFNTFQLGVNYKINFYQDNSLFSYLRTNVIYLFSNSVKGKSFFVDIHKDTYTIDGKTVNETYRVSDNEHNLKSVSSLGAQFITPLYYISDDFVIEGFLEFDLFSYVKNIVYDYSYTREIGLNSYSGVGQSDNDEETVTDFRISPGIGLHYNIFEGIYINASANLKSIGTSIGYDF